MKVGDMVRVKDGSSMNFGGHYGYIKTCIGTAYYGVQLLAVEKLRYFPASQLENITEQADAVQAR